MVAPDKQCPKCGGLCEVQYDWSADMLEWRCLRCGYEWDTYPLDADSHAKTDSTPDPPTDQGEERE